MNLPLAVRTGRGANSAWQTPFADHISWLHSTLSVTMSLRFVCMQTVSTNCRTRGRVEAFLEEAGA